jgi:uncharacterized protein YjbI with pentapeptide repeats
MVQTPRTPDVSQADLRGADFRGIDLRGANLRGANLSHATLTEAHFRGAYLTEAILDHASMRRADLRECDLTGANLVMADLNDAHVTKAVLRDANLSYARLDGTDCVEADLSRTICIGATFTNATLRASSFRDSDLRGADFRNADLRAAKFHLANLRWSRFHSADLTLTNFTRAIVEGTILADVDLRSVKGIELMFHSGPSSIAIETIYRSQGKIPEIFLRGAGLPDAFIVQIKALVAAMEPIQFYSCFISYSTKDQGFADRLHADLQVRGVRCWFAPHDIHGGRKLHEQVDEAIRVYDKLLLILSDASMNSNWVRSEIANARAREAQQKRQMLFPITIVPFDRIREWKLFDADAGIDSAREIREYFIPDFSNWKDHDSYQNAFDRLLRDLNAGAKDKATA